MDEVRGLDRNLFLSSQTTVERDDDDDDRYSLLSPKERLRCVSEMEKSVDSSAVSGDGASSGCGGCSAELMLRCIRAMQCRRPTPTCVITAATSSEVTSPLLLDDMWL